MERRRDNKPDIRVRVLYSDFSEWEGTARTYNDSPNPQFEKGGVAVVGVFYPDSTKLLLAGYDEYSIKCADKWVKIVGRAPYQPFTQIWKITLNPLVQLRHDISNDTPLEGYITRFGKWMSDEEFEEANKISLTWR